MAEGRRTAEWDTWSMWMALYANSVSGKGSKKMRPQDFHPDCVKAPVKHDMAILKKVFIDKQVPEGV